MRQPVRSCVPGGVEWASNTPYLCLLRPQEWQGWLIGKHGGPLGLGPCEENISHHSGNWWFPVDTLAGAMRLSGCDWVLTASMSSTAFPWWFLGRPLAFVDLHGDG
jgi:hypothetical protein